MELVFTCAKAESGLDPNAFRDNGLTDTSVGPFQQTILYAPIGDHTISVANVAFCREKFADWTFAANTAANALETGYAQSVAAGLVGDDAILGALCYYNAGHFVPFGGWWWTSEQHQGYATALVWAHQILGT